MMDEKSEPNQAGDQVLYEVRGNVGLVTLNRPEARNAMTLAMYDRVAEICAAAPGDGTLAAIIIRGAGDKAFAAGTDIAIFRDFSTARHALDYERHMERVLGGIEACPVPTIAAICGACTGGGAAIASACDLRIASRSLKFGYPIARTLGNCLSAGNLSRLAALIGAGRSKELLFTARLIEAPEALAIGLVSEVLEDEEAVMARAFALGDFVAGLAPLTLRATKETLRRLRQVQCDIGDDDLIEMCYMSEDFREGLEAFLAKREPRWKGK